MVKAESRPTHRKDGRASEPQPFTVFVSRQPGKVGVRIGVKRAYASVSDLTISPLAMPLHITRTREGLLLEGEGVVRQLGDTIAITA